MAAQPPNPHFSPIDRPTGDPWPTSSSVRTLTAPASVGEGQLRLVLSVPRRLDHLALSTLLRRLSAVTLVAAEVDLTEAAEACRVASPDAAIFDVSYPERAAYTTAKSLLDGGYVKSVALLDDRFALFRAQRALSIRGACYFTRNDDIREICDRLRRSRRDACALSAADAEEPGPTFLAEPAALKRYDVHGLTSLSPKERQVLEWLARGHTVKEVADALNLAIGTVDNHKSRIMKKLKINRASQLTRIALEAGLID